MVLTVYRSTHPDVLERWEARKRTYAHWRETFDGECAKLGIDPAKVRANTWSGAILGISRGIDDPVPDGWRADKRTGLLKPALKTAAGRKVGVALKAMRRPEPAEDIPGMPFLVWIGDGIYRVRMRLRDGVLYATWPVQVLDGDGVDMALWECVKLSEYYAMVEAEEEARAAAGATS